MFQETIISMISQVKTVQLARGDFLYRAGEKPSALYVVNKGLMGLFHLAASGKETFLSVVTKNSIVGHGSLIAQEIYHSSSLALTPTEVAKVDQSQIDHLCKENPEIYKEFAVQLARDLKKIELRYASMGEKSAGNRIIESLIYLKFRNPSYAWTRKEIADFSNSTLETVTRVLSKLTELGLISKQGRNINILDPKKLLNFTKEDAQV